MFVQMPVYARSGMTNIPCIWAIVNTWYMGCGTSYGKSSYILAAGYGT